ncbi:MAG: NADH-quinone oxidoreductase subunit A [Candidatus Thalassarchaeaceae archaeon]|jgi:NADH:ubiquinone oxidoreductase subunit 3 (subunit A)|nr:NADH-quinone oxidoreductase subunit A [Candidatus Thalassarchaeaceae archaeon]
MSTVSADYLSLGLMTIVGIGFPLGGFLLSRFLRPMPDPNNPTQLRSFLLRGYETDQSLYVRRLSTYECGADPVGDAMIDFHFQYYWYALIFLVFDIAFMFLAFGGIVAMNADHSIMAGEGSVDEATGALVTLLAFLLFMGLGVWYVFRKRGRIYI